MKIPAQANRRKKMKNSFEWLTSHWGITEKALEAMVDQVYRNPEAGVEAILEKTPGTENIRGAAIIPVLGPLFRGSYNRIRERIKAAEEDSSIRVIVLRINSPGGLVSGVKELADFIAEADKPVYAYADGLMASAAYWIGSAAREIAAPVTAGVGSIGVRTLHIDWSKWNERQGLAFTHLAAGSYKVLGNEDEPLSKDAKNYFLDQLNTLYGIFVESVAKQRGVDRKKAEKMADGKMFLAEEARDVGLIDRIETDFESYLTTVLKKEKIMDLAELRKNHPDLYTQVLEEGKQAAAGEEASRTEKAVKEEKDRVLSLAGAVLGEENGNRLAGVVNSGATVDMVTALKDTFSGGENKGGEGTGQEQGGGSASRDEILEGLEAAHSQGVNNQAGKNKADDFNTQAKEFADLANS